MTENVRCDGTTCGVRKSKCEGSKVRREGPKVRADAL
jgi:hypothetical protein